jgi:hypothetical protein
VQDDILLTAATGRPGELNFLDTPVDTSSSSVRYPAVQPAFTGVGPGHDRVSSEQLTAPDTATGQIAELFVTRLPDCTAPPAGLLQPSCILQPVSKLSSLQP